jgi:hypothetical protein
VETRGCRRSSRRAAEPQTWFCELQKAAGPPPSRATLTQPHTHALHTPPVSLLNQAATGRRRPSAHHQQQQLSVQSPPAARPSLRATPQQRISRWDHPPTSGSPGAPPPPGQDLLLLSNPCPLPRPVPQTVFIQVGGGALVAWRGLQRPVWCVVDGVLL